MPQKITEVAFVPMVPEADLTDPDNFAYKIVLHGCEVTRSQPGYERGVWGVLGQNPQIWCTLTDWDDISSHETYTKTPEHDLELEAIAKICNQPIELFHVPMMYENGTTEDNKMRSPIIDVVTGYFTVKNAEKVMKDPAYVKMCAQAVEEGTSAESHQRPASCAFGWAVENDGPIFGTDGIQRGREGKGIEKPWCGLFGWDAIERDHDSQMDPVKDRTSWIEQMGGEREIGRIAFKPYEGQGKI